jgi:small subunit ribosomal protein S5
MSEENTTTETGVVATDAAPAASATPAIETKRDERGSRFGDNRRGSRGPQRGGAGRGARGDNRRGGRGDRPRPEFEQKMISIRRVTRVMAGGRRFAFSVAIVIGDKKGRVGVGIGKAGDTQLAIEKAIRDARKQMITIPTNKYGSIKHDVQAKVASAVVMIKPAPGRGLVAGASVRTVLELAGVKDVGAKILSRSKNTLNNARAAIAALKQLS